MWADAQGLGYSSMMAAQRVLGSLAKANLTTMVSGTSPCSWPSSSLRPSRKMCAQALSPWGRTPTPLCRKVIDVAAKIVRTSGKVILKIAAAAWDFLGFEELWHRCALPPVFCWA